MTPGKSNVRSLLLPPTALADPPKHLSASSKKWFREVVVEFDLSPTDLKLLALAAETLDTAELARATIAKEGTTFVTGENIKPHPSVLILRDSKALFARLITTLHLDGPQAPAARTVGRPPGISTPIVRRNR